MELLNRHSVIGIFGSSMAHQMLGCWIDPKSVQRMCLERGEMFFVRLVGRLEVTALNIFAPVLLGLTWQF